MLERLATPGILHRQTVQFAFPYGYSHAMPAPAQVSPLASELRVVLGQLVRRLRAEHRFPLTHGAVLGRLEREGPQCTVDLAAAERVRPQSMGQTLAELEAQGLISRRRDPGDGRRTLLELTDEGRTALSEDRARRDGWLTEAIDAGFSADEREVLEHAVRLLTRLTEL